MSYQANPKQDISNMSEPNVSTDDKLDDIFGEQVETRLTLRELKNMMRIIDKKLNTTPVDKECASCKELLEKSKECEETADWVRAELKERTAELRSEIERKDEEIQKLSKRINQLEIKNKGKFFTFKGNLHEPARLEKESELTVKNQELSKEIDKKDQEIKTLKSKINQQEINIQKIKTELNDKQSELEAHKNQNDELVLRIEELSKDNEKKYQEVKTLKLTINQHEINSRNIEAEIKDKQKEQNDKLILAIELLKKEVEKKDQEIKFANVNQEINNQKIKFQQRELESRIEELKEEIEKRDREINDLRTSSRTSNAGGGINLDDVLRTSNAGGGVDLDDLLGLNFGGGNRPSPLSSGTNLFFQQNNHITYNTAIASAPSKQYICKNCGRSCASGAGLASHERSCMNRSTNFLGYEQPRQIQAMSRTPMFLDCGPRQIQARASTSHYSCGYCGRVCASGAGLASHERSCRNK